MHGWTSSLPDALGVMLVEGPGARVRLMLRRKGQVVASACRSRRSDVRAGGTLFGFFHQALAT